MDRSVDLVVAGHICFDVIPSFQADEARGLDEILRPGTLVRMSGAGAAAGGAVSNVGLAAVRLGLNCRLMGKVGDDFFGRAILEFLRDHGAGRGMVVVPGDSSSYSIVIAPPAADRMFLHDPGANDTFGIEDLDLDQIGDARICHFGYPTLMARMHSGDGDELETVVRAIRDRSTTVSLDMSLPDPESPAGRAPWPSILRRCLPSVDLFLPSAEELLLLLDRDEYVRRAATGDVLESITADELAWMAARCLRLGAAVVMVKCGVRGLYLRTADADRLRRAGPAFDPAADGVDPAGWANRERWEPPYRVDRVASATGSGDCCIAGFLAGLLRGLPIEDALHVAAAVGASNVTALDAVSGVLSWAETLAAIGKGWPRIPGRIPDGWTVDPATGSAAGPRDGRAADADAPSEPPPWIRTDLPRP